MGNRNGRPVRPRPPRFRGPRTRSFLPTPADIIRILIEEAIRAAIDRRNEQQNGSLCLNYAMTSNCELPGGVMELKSFNNEAMSTEEAVSKLLDGIPPEYEDQLQNPEELIKRLNIDVPPDCMPEVAAALAKHYNQRHLVHMTPSKMSFRLTVLYQPYRAVTSNN